VRGRSAGRLAVGEDRSGDLARGGGEVVDPLEQDSPAARLRQEVVAPGLAGALHVVRHRVCAEDEDGQVGMGAAGPEPLHQLQPVAVAEAHVEQDERRGRDLEHGRGGTGTWRS